MRKCICGNDDLIPFGPEYLECKKCGTLTFGNEISPESLLVTNDDEDFYGKQYWLTHQADSFGYADIDTRSRNDLIERNIHWLKTLLKYALPPAKVLELGCAHGSFIALMRQAGYEARGVEMSPWVVSYGQRTFDVPIEVGPVENLDIPLESLDAIALMDVLEHLPDPISTMRHCLSLLKPNGFLLIQTPEFKEGMKFDELIESNNSFLAQLKSNEHLYLFSKRSIREFFEGMGANFVQFEPAIFSHYDMFLIVGKNPIEINPNKDSCAKLLSTSRGRFVQALLDLHDKAKELEQHIKVIEADREARLEQILTLTEMVNNLQKN